MKPNLPMTAQPAAGGFIFVNVQIIDYRVQLVPRESRASDLSISEYSNS
jgi:hypothetical protein